MPWVDGHIQVNHERHAWDDKCPRHILVHSQLGLLTGEAPVKRSRQSQYAAAKSACDMDAATEIVLDLVPEKSIDPLAEHVLSSDPKKLIIVNPHPEFANGHHLGDPRSGVTNALPFAFAEYLAQSLGGQVDENIEQIARVGRTGMGRLERFLYQPCFTGDVEAGAHYIIADDVVTLGATFAALRSHIVRHGGLICAATAIAHSLGVNQPFPIIGTTLDDLRRLYGDGLFGLWKETIGHEIQSLTEPEGAFLCQWGRERAKEGHSAGDALLQRLRARLDQAASNGSPGEGARGGQKGGR